MPDELRGIGVSPGLAGGPVARMSPPPSLPEARTVLDPDQETTVATDALVEIEKRLRERAAEVTGEAHDIIDAQSMIAGDPTVKDGVVARIKDGADAPHALRDTFDEHRRTLEGLGGYLAERAADLDDIANRAIAVALGLPMPGVPDPGHPFVLVADDLAPADTATLDPANVIGLVTERGGPTSHTAILARSLGLPAVVGCTGALNVEDGTLVTVDGTTGQVRTGVGQEDVAEVRERAEAERARLAGGKGPGRTSDGHSVDLMVNIGSAADLVGVDLTDVAGVGLFRTEFLFLDRHDAPGLEEQVAAYAEAFRFFESGTTIVVRTLDAGADKPLQFLGLPDEPNPALGIRGLRVARDRPEILDLQLEAIALASAKTAADVWVMAPMVSTQPEADAFAVRVREHGLSTAGVMIEVPAAALRARRFLDVVDFLSIGTNDLSQYTLAADRQTGGLADLLDPWQPALLELIGGCAAAGKAAGKSVGICGEAAADPLLAPVLAGLGITKLSMSPRSLPAVRASLAEYTLAECERLAAVALDTGDAAEARAAVIAETTGT